MNRREQYQLVMEKRCFKEKQKKDTDVQKGRLWQEMEWKTGRGEFARKEIE